MEARVLSLVDDTHPAPAEFFDDAVMRDSLTEQREPPALGRC
jgi:hypothetical protein